MTRSIIPALGPDAQRQVRAQLSVPSLTKASEALAGEETNKYRNKKCEAWGIKFDSKRECERYGELLLLQRAGKITRLEAHPRYKLGWNGVDIGHITFDSFYCEQPSGGEILEDVKAEGVTHTTATRLRFKVFAACYPKATVRIVT